MQVQSKVTGKFYTPARCIFITNSKQAALYIKNGLELLDLIIDDENDRLVYVFDRRESQPLYERWQNYELK